MVFIYLALLYKSLLFLSDVLADRSLSSSLVKYTVAPRDINSFSNFFTNNKFNSFSTILPFFAPESVPPWPASNTIILPNKFKLLMEAVTLGKDIVKRKKHISINSLYLFIIYTY